jgi:hypothetical protein
MAGVSSKVAWQVMQLTLTLPLILLLTLLNSKRKQDRVSYSSSVIIDAARLTNQQQNTTQQHTCYTPLFTVQYRGCCSLEEMEVRRGVHGHEGVQGETVRPSRSIVIATLLHSITSLQVHLAPYRLHLRVGDHHTTYSGGHK